VKISDLDFVLDLASGFGVAAVVHCLERVLLRSSFGTFCCWRSGHSYLEVFCCELMIEFSANNVKK
jgi:hypothetical protein